MGQPSFSNSRQTKQERFGKGLRQNCKLSFDSLDLQGELKKFGTEEEGYYHVVIDIAAQKTSAAVWRQLSYAKIKLPDASKWSLELVKQKAVVGDTCSGIETLYGTFPRT